MNIVKYGNTPYFNSLQVAKFVRKILIIYAETSAIRLKINVFYRFSAFDFYIRHFNVFLFRGEQAFQNYLSNEFFKVKHSVAVGQISVFMFVT